MPSFLNFITYLKNHPDIQDQIAEKIHNLLFQSAFSRDVTIDDFVSTLELSGYEVSDLLKKLVNAKVLHWQPMLCDYCGEVILEPIIFCLSCKEKISNQITFHIDGCINEDKQADYRTFSINKAQAKQFAVNLRRKGYMYYLLLDLAESENLQGLDSLGYNEFFNEMRQIMRLKALSQAKYDVLSLGESGDCLKLAFLSEQDFLNVIENFSAAIQKENLENQFPTLRGKETLFPRFDGTIGKITISKYYNDPEKIFCMTLNGALDFNDYELTKFYRLKNHLKTKKKFYDDDIIISVWVHEEIFNDLNWPDISLVEAEDQTHGIPKKGNFGLLGFTKTGVCLQEQEPSKYRE